MSEKGVKCAVALVAELAVLGLGVPAWAETAADAGDTGSNGLEEIIVTARRKEERLQDVPISIAVLNQEQLDNRNIVQGSDLAIYTPSLTVNQRYGPETSSFAIRGFTQEANTAPSVGVYFAEVTAPRSFGATTFGSNILIGSFMDLQNTQILKGPQGTLFGRNTTGGAILLEPQRPSGQFEGYLEASGGNYDMGRGQAVVNIPINDSLKIRLGVDHMERKGYLRNRSGIGPDDFNNTDYTYVRIGVLADLTPNLDNYTVVHFSDSRTNGFQARLIACARNPLDRLALQAGLLVAPSACDQLDRQSARGDRDFDIENSDENPYNRIKQWQLINQTTWHATDNLTVKNIASYSDYVADLSYNLGGENFLTADTGFGLPIPVALGLPYSTTELEAAPSGHTADQWTATEELQLQGNALNQRLIWQAGAYFEVSQSPNFNTANVGIFLSCQPGGLQSLQCFDPYGFGYISAFRTKSIFRDEAGYAQATYNVTEKFSVTGGLRYTVDKIVGIGENTQVRFPLTGGGPLRTCTDNLRLTGPGGTPLVVTDPSRCHEDFPIKSSKPTWLIDFDYKVTPDTLLYAKWARGYRAGGVQTNSVGAETWQPEKLEAYEGGVKQSFHGETASGFANVALFYNNFTNQQEVATLQDKVTQVNIGNTIVNAGKSTIKGVELESAATLFGRLSLNASYAYLDTRLKELSAPFSPIYNYSLLAVQGDPLPLVPKNRVTLTATYKLLLDPRLGVLSFGPTYTHTDRQLITRTTLAQYNYLPSTDLFNLNANWNNIFSHPFDLALFVTNVADKHYPVVIGGSYNSLGYESVQWGQPRMYGVRARYNFGQ